MNLIIPAINALDFEEAEEQFSKALGVLPKGGWVHIDVVDGKFSPAVTWGNPGELKQLITNYQLPRPEGARLAPMATGAAITNIEIHLMVINPELVIESWLEAGARRLIVHAEVLADEEIVTDKCRERGAEAMLAINPETPVQKLLEYADQFHFFQILAVTPGWAGQKFSPEVIDKIRVLREKVPHAKIEVDGGINPETARLCVQAGANILVSASYILSNPNPKQAFEDLQIATNS